jgi:hypothetical protein
MEVKKRPQKQLTEEEKLLIIRSYDLGIKPSVVCSQIQKSATSISTFYSRYVKSQFLPPKEKKSRSLIDGKLGLLIKKQVLETPKLGLRKLGYTLREKLPNAPW